MFHGRARGASPRGGATVWRGLRRRLLFAAQHRPIALTRQQSLGEFQSLSQFSDLLLKVRDAVPQQRLLAGRIGESIRPRRPWRMRSARASPTGVRKSQRRPTATVRITVMIATSGSTSLKT